MSANLFTLEDVAKRNGLDNASTWIIIKDVIYDVTDYLNEHPGGGELLMEYAGKDGTAAFDDFGHSTDAKSILKSYKIGELVENDRAVNRTKNNRKQREKKEPKAVNPIEETSRKNRRSFLRVVCGGCL